MTTAVVKNIAVTVTSTTSDFEAGMQRSSKAMQSLDRSADKIAASMGNLATQLQQGAVTPREYAAGMASLDKELQAVTAGFTSHSAAVERAKAIIGACETQTEKYSRAVEELNTLKKLGALSETEYHKALAKTNQMLVSTSQLSAKRKAALTGQADEARAGGMRQIGMSIVGSRLGGIGTAAAGAGAAALGVVAAGFAARKFARSLGDIEAKAKETGRVIDGTLLAASQRFNQSTAAMSTSWSRFKDVVFGVATPVAMFFGDAARDAAKLLDVVSGLGEKTLAWIRSLPALQQFWGETIPQKVAAAAKKATPNTIGGLSAKDSARSLEVMRAFDAEQRKAFEEGFAAKVESWRSRADELRATLVKAETPMQALFSEAGEINALYERGNLTLQERNSLLHKNAAAQREIVAAANKDRTAKMKEAIAKRVAAMTSAAQNTLDALLAGGRSTIVPTFGALQRGGQEAFAAFQANAASNNNATQLLDTQKRALKFIQDMAKRGIVLKAAGLTA